MRISAKRVSPTLADLCCSSSQRLSLGALLLLVPPTRSVGLLLVSGLLGGAIATHMQHGQSYVGPAVLLVLVWLGAWLRHPETLWSLTHPR